MFLNNNIEYFSSYILIVFRIDELYLNIFWIGIAVVVQRRILIRLSYLVEVTIRLSEFDA